MKYQITTVAEPARPRWPGPRPANDPDPLDRLRRRIQGLLAGPGHRRPDEHDLDAAALHWLAGTAPRTVSG